MIILMKLTLSLQSFLIAHYKREDFEIGLMWVWISSGIIWAINTIIDLVKWICQF